MPENLKWFYDSHSNFADRTLSEYDLSPGIKCKFDTILARRGSRHFDVALDVGCSGNSLLHFLPFVKHRLMCDLAFKPLTVYTPYPRYHPLCGSITQLPFLNETFDFISALDVLEHIPDDHGAACDIVRVLKPRGILVVTVPHRMAFFTRQDQICGHVRRYEYPQIKELFTSRGLKEILKFPVYGQFMRAQFVQEANPQKTEENIYKLRQKYSQDATFRNFWDIIVKISSRAMKLDAKFQPFSQTMDICLVFRK